MCPLHPESGAWSIHPYALDRLIKKHNEEHLIKNFDKQR